MRVRPGAEVQNGSRDSAFTEYWDLWCHRWLQVGQKCHTSDMNQSPCLSEPHIITEGCLLQVVVNPRENTICLLNCGCVPKHFAARYGVLFGCLHGSAFVLIPALKPALIWKIICLCQPVSWRKCTLCVMSCSWAGWKVISTHCSNSSVSTLRTAVVYLATE